MASTTLHLGDCLEILRAMPDASVDAVVTDPPYGLAFMGKRWDYDVPSVEVWAECLRVLKPGGHLLAFAGTRTQHRMACRIEDAGFEIRDMIAWVYGNGFPKSHNLEGDWDGWGTALKPSHEPITLARKPLVGTVAANVRQHGPGALNVDGCRVAAPDTAGKVWTRGGNQKGASLRTNISGEHQYIEANAIGRWPANLIHDGSDEVVALFPDTPAGGYPAHRNTSGYSGGLEQGATPHGAIRTDAGSAARFFYTAKASASERQGVTHPTVKPLDLMAYLCRLVTPPCGTVLDPFMGTGTTIKAAIGEGFHGIGIERDPAYFAMAEHRMNGTQIGLPLAVEAA